MPEFTFEIKGVTLNMDEMHQIHKHYEICCTAEYIIENYGVLEEDSYRVASMIRDLMDSDGYDEDQAIDKILRFELYIK